MSPRLDLAYHFLAARYRWATLRGHSLATYQARRAQRLVQYVQAHSPFYRAHWRDHALADWRTLPIVDKRLMMDNFTEFNTYGVSRETAMQVALHAEERRDFSPVLPGPARLTVGLSSGTSGHRGLFLISPREQAAWAGVILARALPAIPWASVWAGGLRVAFFLRSNSNLYQQTHSALVQFRYFNLMQPLETSVAQLNTFQPAVLIGPPLLLGLLADEVRAGRLTIHPVRLISVADVLEPQEAQRLEAVFQIKVEQIYQCTEGLLAVTCAAGRLHLQEDVVAVQFEALTESEGLYTPIVTDLWRTTQPIIRYRLNDVVALDESPCPCGSEFRVLARIEGRCDDICYFSEMTSSKLRSFFPDTLRRMVLLAHPQIEDYLVVQDAPGQLRVHLALSATANLAQVAAAVQARVTDSVRGYGCRLERIEFVAGVPTPPLGAKRRRVQARRSQSSVSKENSS